MSDVDLDDFIGRTVQRTCPAPRVVSDTALRQLRPVFEELLKVRVALEDVIERYRESDGRKISLELHQALQAAAKVLGA